MTAMNESLEKITQIKNLKLLFQLRNLAIVGQLLSILTVYFAFDLDIAIKPMLVVVFLLAMVNLFTGYRLKYHSNALMLGHHEVFIQLLIDVIALAILIYFSGGTANPFIGFFILQVVIAAILLRPVYTWLIVAITGLAYLFLSYVSHEVAGLSHEAMGHGVMSHGHSSEIDSAIDHEAMGHVMPQTQSSPLDTFNLHLHGMFLGYVIVAVLVAFFVVRMAKNLRDRDQEIYRIQQQAFSETEVMKLGMLAAGAAHELGTPLNAIQLATDELKASLKDNDEAKPTLDLLSRQVTRCCQSVNDLMTVVRQPRALSASNVTLNAFLTDVADNWQHLNPNIRLQCDFENTQGLKVVVDKLLSQALINLLDNAGRVSFDLVGFSSQFRNGEIQLIIEDGGQGIPESIQKKLATNSPITDENGKVRLGLFLVNTLVQRIGGGLSFKQSEEGKSQVVLSIPSEQLSSFQEVKGND